MTAWYMYERLMVRQTTKGFKWRNPKSGKASLWQFDLKSGSKYVSVIAMGSRWSGRRSISAKGGIAGKYEWNVTRGKTLIEDSTDNLVFNYTDQLVVEEDCANNNQFIAHHCVPKDSVPKIAARKLLRKISRKFHFMPTPKLKSLVLRSGKRIIGNSPQRLFWLFCFLRTQMLLTHPGPLSWLILLERVGRNGNYFKMYKFRSMIENAHEMLQRILNLRSFIRL